MYKYLLLCIMISTNVAYADATSNSELQAFKSAIRAKYNMKEQAFKDNDPLPIVNNFYTSDVISTGPDTYIRGRKDLLTQYKKHIADTVRIESVHTYVNGDAGWDWANFYVTPADDSVEPIVLTILFLWEKRDNEWWSPGEMFMFGELK